MNRRLLAAASLGSVLAALSFGWAIADSDTPANPLPAWNAFKKANESVKDYTETLVAHEVNGTRVEDRTYHFAFAKPSSARSTIVSGPGRGGEAVWNGGDHVRGHQGGFLSGIKLTLSITDGRTTDLRGKTITAAFYPTIIAAFEGDGGKMSEEPGPVVDGMPTDAVILVPNDPAKHRGLTKDEMILSRATHLPVEHLGYIGTQLVEDERFTDIKINPDLPAGTFEM
jgi:outer membrane lipoprotein-sorting protein